MIIAIITIAPKNRTFPHTDDFWGVGATDAGVGVAVAAAEFWSGHLAVDQSIFSKQPSVSVVGHSKEVPPIKFQPLPAPQWDEEEITTVFPYRQ